MLHRWSAATTEATDRLGHHLASAKATDSPAATRLRLWQAIARPINKNLYGRLRPILVLDFQTGPALGRRSAATTAATDRLVTTSHGASDGLAGSNRAPAEVWPAKPGLRYLKDSPIVVNVTGSSPTPPCCLALGRRTLRRTRRNGKRATLGPILICRHTKTAAYALVVRHSSLWLMRS